MRGHLPNGRLLPQGKGGGGSHHATAEKSIANDGRNYSLLIAIFTFRGGEIPVSIISPEQDHIQTCYLNFSSISGVG